MADTSQDNQTPLNIQAKALMSDADAANAGRGIVQRGMTEGQNQIKDLKTQLDTPEVDEANSHLKEYEQTRHAVAYTLDQWNKLNNNYNQAANNHMAAVAKLNEAAKKIHIGQAAGGFVAGTLGFGNAYTQLMRARNFGPAQMQDESAKAAMGYYADLLSRGDKNLTEAATAAIQTGDAFTKAAAHKLAVQQAIGQAGQHLLGYANAAIGIPKINQEIQSSIAAEKNSKAQAALAQWQTANNIPDLKMRQTQQEIKRSQVETQNAQNQQANKEQSGARQAHLGILKDDIAALRKDAATAKTNAEKLELESSNAELRPEEKTAAEAKAKAARTAANKADSDLQAKRHEYDDFIAPYLGKSKSESSSSQETKSESGESLKESTNPQGELDSVNEQFKKAKDPAEKAQLHKKFMELYAVVHKGK